jgi:hypothetical protein
MVRAEMLLQSDEILSAVIVDGRRDLGRRER